MSGCDTAEAAAAAICGDGETFTAGDVFVGTEALLTCAEGMFPVETDGVGTGDGGAGAAEMGGATGAGGVGEGTDDDVLAGGDAVSGGAVD